MAGAGSPRDPGVPQEKGRETQAAPQDKNLKDKAEGRGQDDR